VKRNFLKLADCTPAEHRRLFDRAKALKERRAKRLADATLSGRTLAIIFEKHSTRTRLSFEAAMCQLGGHTIVLPPGESQLTRGESLADTARVASRYVDGIVLRTYGEDRLRTFAAAATVPVINGLSDGGHPVQLLADLFTMEERLGPVRGKVVAWVGDGACNTALSWIEAAWLFDFELRIAAPDGYRPPEHDVKAAGDRVRLVNTPAEAVAGADVIATDGWVSMGKEAEAIARREAFKGFTVDEPLLAQAKPSCIVLHALPAQRGEEISAAVLEGPRSVVFDEAENRLYVQKALLELLLVG
jgi:ornithine carbamoyltransferase